MSVPTFVQPPKTVASDVSAATSHQITPDSAIRSQGGAIGPSTLVLMCSYDGASGNQISGITDTSGNTWQRGTSASDSTSVNGEIWYAFNVVGGSAPTITVATSSSVKMKLILAELDQVAPISPLDGTSSPLDTTQARIDTTNSTIRTSSPTSPAPPKVQGQIGVRIGGVAWNDTRTITSTSAWTGLVQLNGGSSNLGVAIERKAAEVVNIAGGNSRASFTYGTTATTNPSAVMSLTFFRDGVMTSTDEDGIIDDIEGVVTVTTNGTTDFIYRSSASAPTGGTGASQMSRYFAFFPRHYKLTGAAGPTIGTTPDLKFVEISGDDTDTNFTFWLDTYKTGQLGSTLDSTDENVAGGKTYSNLVLNATVTGAKTISLVYADDINPTGVTAIQLRSEGDGMGTGTSNWLEVGDYSGNVPAYIVLYLTYPALDTPQRMLTGMGT